jgi:hypothetical protein
VAPTAQSALTSVTEDYARVPGTNWQAAANELPGGGPHRRTEHGARRIYAIAGS